MDLFILLGGFTVLTLLGMPVAYALGLAAIFTALWIDLPLEAVMLKVSDGIDDFALLGDSVLHPGRRHHGRRRHGRAAGQSCQDFRRLHPRRAGAGQYPRLHLLRRHFRLLGRRHGVDRLGDDPADGQERLSALVRGQRNDLGLAAAASDPALAQRGDLFARRRRHRVGRPSVHRRRHSRCLARLFA